MKKMMTRFATLFSFCLVFAFVLFAPQVHADSVNVEKLGYIDQSTGNRVLYFGQFSTSDYTVTANGGVVISNENGCVVAGNTTTSIKVMANDGTGNFIEAAYNSSAVKPSALSATTGNKTVTMNWAAADNSKWVAGIYNVTSGMKKIAGTTVGTKSAALSVGNLAAGTYDLYAVSVATDAANNVVSYGYATKISYKYVPLVTGLKATSQIGKVALTWAAAPGVTSYEVYMNGVKKADVSTPSYTVTGLAAGTTYRFKVRAKDGNFTPEVSCVPSKDPGAVTGAKFTVDDHGKMAVTWTLNSAANGYLVKYKIYGTSTWYTLGETSTKRILMDKLDPTKKYTVRIYAKKNGSVSAKCSVDITTVPKTFLSQNRQAILAKRLVKIGWLKNKAVIDTSKHFTKEIKEAYCNYYVHKSKTKYMILVCLYTQEAAIMKGSYKKWKVYKQFDIAGGSPQHHTPQGKFKIYKKEYKWQYPTKRTMWVSRFYKKASFHSRPKWNSGKFVDARMRQPISNACVRCYDEDAIWIYKNIPMGTLVRVK